ncbi:hypothetical protein ACFL7M_14845 [Thermodesulfobacteriota bacterium]
MKCLLCGFDFFPDDTQCGGCPISKGCKTICCPHCGYQTVGGSGVLTWIKKIFNGGKIDGTEK